MNNISKHIQNFLIIFLLLFCISKHLMGFELYPELGYQRAGTSALPFLKIGIGSRAASMGGSFVGIADDASCLYWNPAGASQMKSSEILSSRIDWPANIAYDYIGAVYKISDVYAFGISGGFLHTDAMNVTTEYMPHGTGEKFYFNDYFLSVTASQRITKQFSWGISFKYVEENIAELSSRTPMIDIGTFYWTGFRSLRFAVSLINFGPNVSFDGTYEKKVPEGGVVEEKYKEFPLPTIFRIGSAMEIVDTEYNKFTLTSQLNHPIDNVETFSIGFEETLLQKYSIRGGLNLNDSEKKFNIGLGLKLPIRGNNIVFDYSFSRMRYLTDIQRFTLKIKL